jgi:hypothetical protein
LEAAARIENADYFVPNFKRLVHHRKLTLVTKDGNNADGMFSVIAILANVGYPSEAAA